MRPIIALLIFTSFSSCTQPTVGQTFTFTDIGWTINLPEGFKLLDSSAVASRIASGKQLVGQSSGINFDSSKRKLLIFAKKGSNSFMSSVTPYSEAEHDIWLNSNNQTRELLFRTISKNVPSAKFDSSSSTEIIDALVFRKFKITGNENEQVIYNSIMLSKFYKGYDFEMHYVFGDKKIGLELEEMLKHSHFTK
jgi:hypothetical protein